MKHYRIIVGQGFDKNGETIEDLVIKQVELKATLLRDFGGYSLSLVEGGYTNSNGDSVLEPALVIDLFVNADNAQYLHAAYTYVKALFDQESIVVETFNSTVDFV